MSILGNIDKFIKSLAVLSIALISIQVQAVTLDGYSMTTPLDNSGQATDAIAVFDITLPQQDELLLTAIFTGDLQTNTIQVTFNDNSIPVISGILTNNATELNYIFVDISAYKGQVGELKLTLHNSGTMVSELYVIESAAVTAAASGTSSSAGGGGGGAPGILIAIMAVLGYRKMYSLRKK